MNFYKHLTLFLLFYLSVIVLPNSTTASEPKSVIYGYTQESRTLIPLRTLSEQLGIDVEYNLEKQEIKLKKENNEVIFYIGENYFYHNSNKIIMETSPLIIQGNTYIPVKYLLDSLKISGYQFNAKDHTLSIKRENQTDLIIYVKPITSAYLYEPIKIQVIMYHDFKKDTKTKYTIDPDLFRSHIQALKRAGYETITDQDVINYRKDSSYKLPKKPLLITIDDGYLSNYTYAYPILKQEGFRATIYPIVERSVQRNNRYITWSQMREMVQSGVINIQSHTYNQHHYIKGIDGRENAILITRAPSETTKQYKDRVRDDLFQSKKVLEEQLGIKINVLSYPYGMYNSTVENIAKDLGFELFITGKRSTNTRHHHKDLVFRYNIDGHFTANDVLKLLE